MGRIVWLVSCLLCAFPFLIISVYEKDSRNPIAFWSGDTSLKNKIKDVKGYNQQMAALYRKCAIAFVVCALAGAVHMVSGIVVLVLVCTVGFYMVYREYKRILGSFS